MKKFEIIKNSGVEQAGVKIRRENWGTNFYVRIKFIGEDHFLGEATNGYEVFYQTEERGVEWFLFEEQPKKTVLMSPALVDLGGLYGITQGCPISLDDAKYRTGNTCVAWPIRIILKNIDHIDASSFEAELWVPVEEKK